MFGLVHTSPIPSSIPTGNEPLPYVILAPVPAVTTRFSPDPLLPSDSSAQVHDGRARLLGATQASRSGYGCGTGGIAMGLVSGGVSDERGTSGLSSSPSFSYGSGLVHRQRQGTSVYDIVERSLGHVHGGSILQSASRIGVLGIDKAGVSGHGTHASGVGLCPPRDICCQQVESEQRCCNELRTGFARLKEALPISDEKCSKLALLERETRPNNINVSHLFIAATYISHLEEKNRTLTARLDELLAITDSPR
ncbi:hypothetical protein FRC12_019864 [Ceratobasidium sp. 428]|nr:hypothetical protein FRC12_019864 [Ceratobasidium sp. 428]